MQNIGHITNQSVYNCPCHRSTSADRFLLLQHMQSILPSHTYTWHNDVSIDNRWHCGRAEGKVGANCPPKFYAVRKFFLSENSLPKIQNLGLKINSNLGKFRRKIKHLRAHNLLLKISSFLSENCTFRPPIPHCVNPRHRCCQSVQAVFCHIGHSMQVASIRP